MPRLTANARNLRRTSTDAERALWSRLRAHRFEGHKFRRQQPIGRYIVDFACLEARVVIELDGGQHALSTHDAERDAWLQAQGFRVLRFWNNDVTSNLEGVLVIIAEALSPAAPPSLDEGEGAGRRDAEGPLSLDGRGKGRG